MTFVRTGYEAQLDAGALPKGGGDGAGAAQLGGPGADVRQAIASCGALVFGERI